MRDVPSPGTNIARNEVFIDSKGTHAPEFMPMLCMKTRGKPSSSKSSKILLIFESFDLKPKNLKFLEQKLEIKKTLRKSSNLLRKPFFVILTNAITNF